MSLVGMVDGRMTHPWTTPQVVLAVGLGVYVAGVTLFARTEAAESNRRQLTAGIGVVVAGLALIASAPTWTAESPLRFELLRWWLLWGLLAMVIVRRCLIAWREPTPLRVQQAVRLCIRSIIVIDAAIVLGFCGPAWGCAVLALLVPMLVLECWASTT
jgi:4-hydroxybenzoate polyprenyltransferase